MGQAASLLGLGEQKEAANKRVAPVCRTCGNSVKALPSSALKGQSARAKRSNIWPRNKKVLHVFFVNKGFMQKNNWKYDGEPMICNLILSWANIWSNNRKSAVPTFRITNEVSESDIRVLFHGDKNCCTIVGSQAGEGKHLGKPTMWLDLDWADDSYILHLVLHEFGHALGLEHEHQHSLFLHYMKMFLDVDKMKTSLGVNQQEFDNNWGPRDSQAVDESEYDPNSVMHYWFDPRWLHPQWQNDSSTMEYALKDDAKKVLRGIQRRSDLATKLSATDILFIEHAYAWDDTPPTAGSSVQSTCASSDAPALPRRAKTNRVAADSGSDDDTSAAVSGPAKGLVSESGHDEDEGTIQDVVPRKQLEKPATGSGPPKIPPPPEQHGGETQSTPSEQQEEFGQFKWRKGRGKVNVYRLRDDFSTYWQELGQTFGLKRSTLTNIATRRREDPVKCFDDVISSWELNGSVPKTAYLHSWEGLMQALRDMGNVSRKVDELEATLKYKL